MENQQGVVKAVLETPNFINKDKNYGNRRCYYKQLVLPVIGSTYVKVIVQKSKWLGWNKCHVINAYACDKPSRGETLKWKKN